MTEIFELLATQLKKRPRLVSTQHILCQPQACSLMADEVISEEFLQTHFLSPSQPLTTDDKNLGVYKTMNGKTIKIRGSIIQTGPEFNEKRTVRILLSEIKMIEHQEITILHINRPLTGGILVPSDPDSINHATYQKYNAILRSYFEAEWIFKRLDETIKQAKKIALQQHLESKYNSLLPELLRSEWERSVNELVRITSRKNQFSDMHRMEIAILPLQQVIECYLHEQMFSAVFGITLAVAQPQEIQLRQVLEYYEHYTPQDLNIQKEYQCDQEEAITRLLDLNDCRTPLAVLQVLRECLDSIHFAVVLNLERHQNTRSGYYVATDHLLDQLIFVLIQVYARQKIPTACSLSAPTTSQFGIPSLASILQYVEDYHFINSNISALGFAMANFQVATEYLISQLAAIKKCSQCRSFLTNSKPSKHVPFTHKRSSTQDALTENTQSFHHKADHMPIISQTELCYWENIRHIQAIPNTDSPQSQQDNCCITKRQLLLIDITHTTHRIHCATSSHIESAQSLHTGPNTLYLSTNNGKLITLAIKKSARGDEDCIAALDKKLYNLNVTHVACGALHVAVSDINGHVFAWGDNSRKQLGILLAKHSLVKTPKKVDTLSGQYIHRVACGEYFSAALTSRGRMYSWGCNAFGQLGRHTLENTGETPDIVQCPDITRRLYRKSYDSINTEDAMVCDIIAGTKHMIALTRDGCVYTWGCGDTGQLGHGSFMDVSIPKQVLALADTQNFFVKKAAASFECSVFLTRDGIVLTTGKNGSDENEWLFPRVLQYHHPSKGCRSDVQSIACNKNSVILKLHSDDLVAVQLDRDTYKGIHDIVPLGSNVTHFSSNDTFVVAVGTRHRHDDFVCSDYCRA